MSNVSDRMKSPSFKRKMKISQSVSAPSSATSPPPTTTAGNTAPPTTAAGNTAPPTTAAGNTAPPTIAAGNTAPPLPPMSSHPVLMRRQTTEEALQVLHRQKYYPKTHTVQNSSSSSQHTNEDSTDGPKTSTSSSKAPPALPPKPKEPHPYAPFIPLLQRPAASSLTKEDDTEYSHVNPKALSLEELNRSPYCKLPMQVMVATGFQGPSKKSTISDGETLNLLCWNKRELVMVETLTGTKVKVPMNSSLQFGILYNPTNNLMQAAKGFHYKTAGHILSSTVLPKLICATKQHKAGKEKQAIQKGDILLLKETTSKGHSKRVLSCIHLESGKPKKLFEDCAGQFTTQPERVKMFLPEIINHIDPPQMAVVFFPEEQQKADFSSGKNLLLAHQEVVKITQVISEKSILATRFCSSKITSPPSQNGRSSSHVVLDIPINHPTLKVRIIQSSPSEQESIVKLAKEVVQVTAKTNQHHVRIGSDVGMFDATMIHKSDDSQQQQPSTSSETGPLLRRNPFTLELQSTFQDPQVPAQDDSSLSLDADASPRSVEAYAFFDPKKSTFAEALGEEDEEYVQMNPDLQPRKSETPSLSAFVEEIVGKKLQAVDDTKQKQIERLREEMANLRLIVEDLQSQCKEINSQQAINSESLNDVRALAEENKLKFERSHSSSSGSHKQATSDVSQQSEREDKQQQCREMLKTMSCERVLGLLDKMNLGKYKERFEQEQIDGSLLLSCDNQILESELGITSRLHRVKMLRLIEGDIPDVLIDLF